MSDTTRMSGPEGGVRSVRVTFNSVVLGVAAVLAIFALRSAFVAAHRVLSWAAASAAVAVLVEPLVNWLGRRIPRVAAVLLTFVIVGVAAAGLVFGSVDDLDRQVDRLKRAAPAATAELESRDDELGQVMRDLALSERIDAFLDELDERVGSGTGALAQNAPSAPIYFVNAILTIFMLVYGPAIFRGGLTRIGDARRQQIIGDALVNAIDRARRTFALFLAQGAVIGLAAWGTAVLIGLPAPIVLGLVAAVGAMLPDVGIVLGMLPMLALTAGLENPRLAGLLLVVAVLVQTFEALYVRARADEWGVAVGPAIVWIVGLVGFTIYGFGAVVFGVAYATFVVGLLDQVPAVRDALDEIPDAAAP